MAGCGCGLARFAATIYSVNSSERIGDAERDAAVESLQEHMSLGRLTSEEFDERMSKALQARTQGDMAALFADLPGGAPDSTVGRDLAPAAEDPGALEPAKSRLMENLTTWVGIGLFGFIMFGGWRFGWVAISLAAIVIAVVSALGKRLR